MKRIFIGIDLGTSALKLVSMDEEKRVLFRTTVEYESTQPNQGWNEIEPRAWIEGMQVGMNRLLAHCDRSLVEGIGITGQMHTLVILDGDGNPLRPAIMWNDIRAAELISKMKTKIRTFEEGDYLSQTISTGSPAVNLYWIKCCEPEIFNRIKSFLIAPDYLVYWLTGSLGTDYCQASTSCLYQIRDRCWSAGIRDFIGLREDMYPQIHGSAEPAGYLKKEAAALFSLREDVTVVTGTGDNPAAAVSTGCLWQDNPVISLGTSGVFMMPMKSFQERAKGKVILFSLDGQDISYLVQGAVQSNGSALEWWMRGIMGVKDFSEVDRMVDIRRTADQGLLFYPHLMGDKTLYGDPDIRGALIGLSRETDNADIVYAVIEGLCFSFRELAEKMRLPLQYDRGIKVVGGGASSRVWMQTLANVLNVRIEQLDGEIGPAYGAALLAACGCGGIRSLKEITGAAVRINHCFLPEPDLSVICERKYQAYLRIHKGLSYITQGRYN